MAKIPRQFARELPPIAPSEGIFGQMTGTALARAGRGIYEMGVDLEEAHERLMQAHRVSVFNRKISQASVDLMEMQERAIDDTDYPTMPERYASEIDDYRSEILGDITDPSLNQMVSMKFDEIAAQKLINIRSYARKGIVAEGEASVTAALDALTDIIVKTTDPQERASYIGMVEGIVKGGTAAGCYYADKEEALLSAFRKNLPVKQIEHDLFFLGPKTIIERLESNKLTEAHYPGLDNHDRYVLLERAREELREQEKKESGAYETTDPEIEAMVVDKILHHKGPQITLEELQKYHSNGLSTKDFEHWHNVLKAKLDKAEAKEYDPIEEGLKKAYKAVDDFYQLNKDDKDVTPSMKAEWKIRIREAVLKRGAKTEMEVIEIAREIMEPEVDGWFKKFLTGLWESTQAARLYKKIFKEGEEKGEGIVLTGPIYEDEGSREVRQSVDGRWFYIDTMEEYKKE